MKIYTITMFEDLSTKEGCFTKASRCVGFYEDFYKAEKSVINNDMDIMECLYEYAIIEEINEGLYPYSSPRRVYRFNDGNKKFELIDTPTYLRHVYGATIG